MNVLEIMARAEKTNLERDAAERNFGFTPVSRCPPDAIVRTAIDALNAGIAMDDWNCVAEAADMLAKLANYHPWKGKTNGH